jgi:hypothetical protein
MPEEPELNQTVLNQGSQIEATKMMQEMIQESVSILLDANGNVSPSIAEVLGIQDLVVSVDPNHLDVMMSGEDRQKQKMARDKIVFQLVYSFASQIMIGGLRGVLDEEYKDNLEVGKKIIALSIYLEKKCMQLDNNKVPRITPFFKRELIEALFDKSVYSDEVVGQYLMRLPVKVIGDIVNQDIYGSTSEFWNFMPHDQENYNDLMAGMLIARGDFWVEIMKFLQAQGDILRLIAVMKVMPESRLEKWRSLKNTMELSPEDVEASEQLAQTLANESAAAASSSSSSSVAASSLSGAIDGSEEQKGEPPVLESYEVDIVNQAESAYLAKFFNARDNLYLLNYILHAEIRPMLAVMDPNVRQVISELEVIKFDPAYIPLPTVRLFEIAFDRSQFQADFLQVIRKHFPDLSAHLELRFIDADEPLMIAAKNDQWEKVIQLTQTMPLDVALDAEVLGILLANKEAITDAYFKSLNPLSLDEKVENITRVLHKQSKLSVIIAAPDVNQLARQLAIASPQAVKLYAYKNPNDYSLPIGLETKDWVLIMQGLLSIVAYPQLSIEDKKMINENRDNLVEALINYANANYSPVERIQFFNTVIDGENALGKLLNESTASWFSLSIFRPIRDNNGNRVTSHIADIIENRDTVQALLNSMPAADNEQNVASDGEERKMSSPSRRHQ